MKTVFSIEYNNYLIELKMLGDFIFLYIDNIKQDFSEFERKVTLSYNGNDTIKISLKKPRFHKQWKLNVIFNNQVINEKFITSTGTIITNDTTKKEKGVFIKR